MVDTGSGGSGPPKYLSSNLTFNVAHNDSCWALTGEPRELCRGVLTQVRRRAPYCPLPQFAVTMLRAHRHMPYLGEQLDEIKHAQKIKELNVEYKEKY